MKLVKLLSAMIVATTLGATAVMATPQADLAAQAKTTKAKAVSYDKSLVWPSRTITYHINSTGSYYRGIWTKAVKSWNAVKVVKLVKVSSNAQAQVRLSTKADVGKGKYPGIVGASYKVNSVLLKSRSMYLSRRYMKEHYYSKHERTLFAMWHVGGALGLEDTSTFGDVMSDTLMYNVGGLSKADKQGLKNAYQHVK